MFKTLFGAGLALGLTAGAAHAQTCVASFYRPTGHPTASGRPMGMTAAHRTARFGSHFLVSHRGFERVVEINDRGPFTRGRCLDLSFIAARALHISGTALVTLTALD